MNNHFHLYVYLPKPPQLTDDEVIKRFHQLKGNASSLLIDASDDRIPGVKTGSECQTLSANSETGSECQTPSASLDPVRARARELLAESIRRRMYSIAEYMRMIKKWFSDSYNERNGHKGTMWEAVYGDHSFFLPERLEDYTDLRDILAYIHLNPIRAALAEKFDGYEWSSYTAFCRGEPDAVRAMRFAYRGYDDDVEIKETHEMRMNALLEDWKRRRAVEIARKRVEGYTMPVDPLTEECLVAQATAHAAEVQKELEQLHAERDLVKGSKARRELIIRQIKDVLFLHPDFNAERISSVIHVPERTVYRYIRSLRKQSAVSAAA